MEVEFVVTQLALVFMAVLKPLHQAFLVAKLNRPAAPTRRKPEEIER